MEKDVERVQHTYYVNTLSVRQSDFNWQFGMECFDVL